MQISRHDTAVVVIDPQRGQGVHETRTGENMDRILKAARRNGLKVFVAPHYFYATDDGWEFREPREAVEDDGGRFDDLVVALRGHGIRQVILGGMVANMCVESRLRDLLEQGFAVVVAKDATGGARDPEQGDGYTAGLIDFAFLAHAALSTDDLVSAMG